MELSGSEFVVHTGSPEGSNRSFRADLVVHGGGRTADIEDMSLDTGNVAAGKRGVQVNEFLQSVTNAAVYAAGDAADTAGPPLTPVAGYEGRIAAENMLDGNHSRPSYEGVASVVFTIPPLAMAGLTEEAAKKRGHQFRTHFAETAGWYSSRRIGEAVSGFKILIEEKTDLILGAHLLGHGVEELINVFSLALKMRISARDLGSALYAYPTLGSNIGYMISQ